MTQLAAQGEGFLDTCKELMRRMVETVPKDVVLGSVVEPMGVKFVDGSLDLDAGGGVVFGGLVRVSLLSL